MGGGPRSPRENVYLPDHPLATRNGYLMRARVVLYAKIGDGPHKCRWCSTSIVWHTWRSSNISDQIVADHLNGDTLDDRPENLVESCFDCNSRRQPKGVATRRKIFDVVSARGPIPLKDIAAEVEMAAEAVRGHLRKLEGAGLVAARDTTVETAATYAEVARYSPNALPRWVGARLSLAAYDRLEQQAEAEGVSVNVYVGQLIESALGSDGPAKQQTYVRTKRGPRVWWAIRSVHALQNVVVQ